MFLDFLTELRAKGVRVGPHEGLQLARALEAGLGRTTLDGFYDVARALCVHREQDLDAFDRAFAHHFRGVPEDALRLTDELLEWLKDAKERRDLTEEERELLQRLDPEALRKLLQDRLREQTERHDGGSKWVGTGGTSPFGRGGENPNGMRVGEGPRGGRGALRAAEERHFQELRSDVTLDTRQIELVLRRLRAFVREGAEEELDLEGTIDATARNAGELEVRLRPPRRSNLRVLLLLDVGGSMDPFAGVCERLFSAAKRATHFKELRTCYFHNCVYGRVFEEAGLWKAQPLSELMRRCDPTWKLIVVGDALMHPWELHARGVPWSGEAVTESGLESLRQLAAHFPSAVWLNPESEVAWYGTARQIRSVFPMYRLTADGLLEAVHRLVKRGQRA